MSDGERVEIFGVMALGIFDVGLLFRSTAFGRDQKSCFHNVTIQTIFLPRFFHCWNKVLAVLTSSGLEVS